MSQIHISLAGETLGYLGSFPITNSLLMSWVVVFSLIIFAFFVSRNIKFIPGRFQTTLELMIGGARDYMAETLEDKKIATTLLPLLASIFFFILFGNLIQLLPGVGSVGFFSLEGERREFVSLLRGMTADLNVTLALALISLTVIEFMGISQLGFLKYVGKFVTFKSPLQFAIGIIDLFSELARLVSFSFRLFGNIFAGEVMIALAVFFVPFFLPVPLLLFEVMVGIIQAAVFALLTLFFVKNAITPAHH